MLGHFYALSFCERWCKDRLKALILLGDLNGVIFVKLSYCLFAGGLQSDRFISFLGWAILFNCHRHLTLLHSDGLYFFERAPTPLRDLPAVAFLFLLLIQSRNAIIAWPVMHAPCYYRL